jgi:ABC-type Fe3+-hydroxamate transport system substrate-binding protein
LLYDLGLNEEVVGITKFCVHPDAWFRSKTRVGGTKNFKPEVIRELVPDLILANKEENDFELLNSLMDEFPVWVSDISTLEDAMEMINSTGLLTGRENEAAGIVSDCRLAFSAFNPPPESARVIYLIWQDPWMCAGKDTFIHQMIEKCGWKNLIEENRYPEISMEAIQALRPDKILLSSEPYPFREKHRIEIHQLFPETQIQLVDGEFFSWYGSRLRFAPGYFASIL